MVDVGGVSRGCRELAVVGQQGKGEGFGQGDVHGVVGAEVLAQLEYSRLQRLHSDRQGNSAGVSAAAVLAAVAAGGLVRQPRVDVHVA